MEVPGRSSIPFCGRARALALIGVFGSRGGPTSSLTRLPSSRLRSKLESPSELEIFEELPLDRVRCPSVDACAPPLVDTNTSSSRLLVRPAARSPSPTRLLPPVVPNRPSELPVRCPCRLPGPSNDCSGRAREGEERSSDIHRIWCFRVSSFTVEYRDWPSLRGDSGGSEAVMRVFRGEGDARPKSA